MPGRLGFVSFPFLSTLSLRRATALSQSSAKSTPISIHALLAESDGFGLAWLAACFNFYPRSPCGERLRSNFLFNLLFKFLSTLSLRRATLILRMAHLMELLFLSTLSLRRATQAKKYSGLNFAHFYPRSPCGERRGFGVGSWPRRIFLSTLSLRRATQLAAQDESIKFISIHALLAESDAAPQISVILII